MSKVKKENRTEFRWFSISEYEKEEEYLSKQHGMGWKLTGITFPGFYHFTKCHLRQGTDKGLPGQQIHGLQ